MNCTGHSFHIVTKLKDIVTKRKW